MNQKSTNFLEELRSAIHDTDCDPGIIRKILSGRSITSDVEDGNVIRQTVWPALLGVAKREMKDSVEDTDPVLEKVFKEFDLPESSVSGKCFFALIYNFLS